MLIAAITVDTQGPKSVSAICRRVGSKAQSSFSVALAAGMLICSCGRPTVSVVSPVCDDPGRLTCDEVFSGDPILRRLDSAVNADEGDGWRADAVFHGGVVFPQRGMVVPQATPSSDCEQLLDDSGGSQRVDLQPLGSGQAYCLETDKGGYAVLEMTSFETFDPDRFEPPVGAASEILAGSQFEFDLNRLELSPGLGSALGVSVTRALNGPDRLTLELNSSRHTFTYCDVDDPEPTLRSFDLLPSTQQDDRSRWFCYTSPTQMSGYLWMEYFNGALFWRIATQRVKIDALRTAIVPLSSINYRVSLSD